VLTRSYTHELCAVGEAAGLDRVGVASAEPFGEARVALETRRARGLAGSMQFTYRNPARSTDPAQTLPGVASLVVGARRYDREVPPPPTDQGPVARVARYAVADHYGQLRAGLTAIADRLVADGWSARVVLDDNALVDRAAAHRAALGWFGKNANILVPGIGSWVVLGSVLTDAPLPAADEPVPDGCGGCRRCLDGCPTNAIIEPGVVDARRCLAWLVQAEGVFPVEHRVALGDRLYGCDDCQEVCPPSKRTTGSSADSAATAVSGPLVGRSASWVSVLEVLDADDETLLRRFGRWYIPGRELRYLRRNALVVLGNVGDATDPAVGEAIRRALLDDDPLVRAHAVWAARRLGLDRVTDQLADQLAEDDDPMVRAELDRHVDPR
jgi:epoxyqueuosine reductase